MRYLRCMKAEEKGNGRSLALLLSGAASLGLSIALLPAAPAQAQSIQAQTIREQCNQKYQTDKASGLLNGRNWTQYYSDCVQDFRVGAANSTAAETVAQTAPAVPANPLKPAKPVTPATPKPQLVPEHPEAAATGTAVFPPAISAKYQAEKPAKARQKTCLDQYNANKAAGGAGNGGLTWIQKGGGYYSECNKHLKGE